MMEFAKTIFKKLDFTKLTCCWQNGNISAESKHGRRMNPIFLAFKSKSLERRFQEYFYGSKVSARIGITSIFGSLMYMSFAVTTDFGILFQMIPDVIIGVWFFIFSVLCFIPCFVRRRCLFEFIFLLSCLIVTTRTGASDIYMESTRPIYHSPVKYGLFHFEVSFILLVLPRCVILLPCCIINSIFFTIYIIIIEAPQKRGLSLYLFSTVCYYVNEALLYLLIYMINLHYRINFLKIEKLTQRNQSLQNQVIQTRSLLHNIIPSHFIDIISRRQNKNSSPSIIFPIHDGIILESDLVDFTRISSECDCERLTDVLNTHFCTYDILCVELGMTKIKSVGDSFEAYVSLDNYDLQTIQKKVNNCVLFGIGIIKSVRRINEWKEISFSVRIGICRGKFNAVCMGKMGQSKLSFDIFGDTLKRCILLEQEARPDSVHVDAAIHHLVRDNFDFTENSIEEEEEEDHQDQFETIFLDDDIVTTYLIDYTNSSSHESLIKDEALIYRLDKMFEICDEEIFPPKDDEKEEEEEEEEEKSKKSNIFNIFRRRKKREVMEEHQIGHQEENISNYSSGSSSSSSDDISLKVYYDQKCNNKIPAFLDQEQQELEPVDDKINNNNNSILRRCCFFSCCCCCCCCFVLARWLFKNVCLNYDSSLCFPFCCFLDPRKEIRSYFHHQHLFSSRIDEEEIKKKRRLRILNFGSYCIFHLLVIYYLITTEKISQLLVDRQPSFSTLVFLGLLGFNTFTNFSSLFLFCLISFRGGCWTKKKKKKKKKKKISRLRSCFMYSAYTLFSFVNIFSFRIELLSLYFLDSSGSTVQYGLISNYFLCHLIFLVIDDGFNSHLKILFFMFDSFIHFVSVLFIIQDFQFLVKVNMIQLMGIASLAFIISFFMKEINIRKSYFRQHQICEKNEMIVREKTYSYSLILSVLPKEIVSKIFRHYKNRRRRRRNFLGYSKSFPNCFVCFIRIEKRRRRRCGSDSKKKKEEDDTMMLMMINFLSSLFLEYDQIVDSHDCISIKKIRTSYLFISKDHSIQHASDILRKILDILDLCRDSFRKKQVMLPCSSNDNATKTRRSIFQMKIGLSHGELRCGVLGKTRFLFDIFGSVVNLSARLCSSSEDCKISVHDDNLRNVIQPSSSGKLFELQSRGNVVMKGRGMLPCSFIEKKN